MASAGGGERNAIITPRAIINSVSNGNGGRRTVDCCRSSEIILEGFVFSPALPIVLLNYSTGIPTVSLSPLRAAGEETLFCWKEFVDSAACLRTFRDIVTRKGVLVYKKCELFSHSMCLVRHADKPSHLNHWFPLFIGTIGISVHPVVLNLYIMI